MRIPRSLQLAEPNGFVHKFWRCHNREHYLSSDSIKELYLNCAKEALEKDSIHEHIKIHAYCAMDNHFHKIIQFLDSSAWLSSFMRRSHSQFGRLYNNIKNRSGKVAEGRPKTPLIQNYDHLIEVHFYVEANPVRARKMTVENLKHYRYSSYRFYAFGIRDKFTELLTIPEWYLALGKTSRDRQRKHRKLFYAYLKEKGINQLNGFLDYFIGSQLWILDQRNRVQVKMIDAKTNKSVNSS